MIKNILLVGLGGAIGATAKKWYNGKAQANFHIRHFIAEDNANYSLCEVITARNACGEMSARRR